MEQVPPYPLLRPESRTSSLHIPRYLLAMLLLLLGCAGVTLSVRALGQNAQPPLDPFASFDDVFPGQPRSAIVARRFSCLTNAYENYSEAPNELCLLRPKDGLFSQVSVGVKGDIIRNILFILRDNTLTIGDLMMLWGKQDFHMYNGTSYFYWGDTGNTATGVSHSRRFSLFLPLRSVYIQGKVALSGLVSP
jgi:hypothetical protein